MNALLYGKDDERDITGVRLLFDDSANRKCVVRVYYADKSHRDEPFFPFFFLSDITLMTRFPSSEFKHARLHGDNYYKHLVVFNSWKTMWEAIRSIKTVCHERGITGYNHYIPPVIYMATSIEEQFLLQRGKTFFKGMEFNDVHRLYLDIEAFCHREDGFPDASAPEDRIIIVSLCDNRGMKELLYLEESGVEYPGRRYKSEKELLLDLKKIILQLDPDVITGHNIFSFDLPYIFERAERHNINFDIGRDNTRCQIRQSKKTFAEREIQYSLVLIPGRSVVDTYFQAMSFDVFFRNLPSYGLKEVAKHFELAPEGRTYIEGKDISRVWRENPEMLLRYAGDDATETKAIAEHLGGADFYLTQMLPMTYQQACIAGTSRKIESLMVREYLRRRYSIPCSEEGRQEVGGYTDIFYTGVYSNIIYADVASLYPSIMLGYDVKPSSDNLNLFQQLLKSLTELRFKAKNEKKRLEKIGADSVHIQSLDARQNSYKTLINSFYGMLGFSESIFNDFSEADRVAVTGQEILRKIIKTISEDGGFVIEADTDGVLARPPEYVYIEDDEEDRQRVLDLNMTPVSDVEYVDSISRRMPEIIKVDFDGRVSRMLSYKKKNYAIIEHGSNKVKIKGGSLISRMYEKFGKDFVEDVIKLLLMNDVRAVCELYQKYWLKIVSHDWEPEDFCKTITLKDSISVYEKKISEGARSRSAQYELAIKRYERTGIKPLPGDRISYYVAGDEKPYKVRSFESARLSSEWDRNNPDENTAWYLKRLEKFADKFKVFFTKEHFKIVFSEKTKIDEVNWDEIKILNNKIERQKIDIYFCVHKSIQDDFWIARSVSGARFLKTLDEDGVGLDIGVVYTTPPGSAVRSWAEKNGIPCRLVERGDFLQKLASGNWDDAALIVVSDANDSLLGIYEDAEKRGITCHYSKLV